jgi:hypothetical protein
MAKSKKIRESARGEDCSLMIFPYCNQNNETTVYAHINSDSKGMGIKSSDLHGCYACSVCHDIIDGRLNVELDKCEVLKCMIRGIQRTTLKLYEKGLLVVG